MNPDYATRAANFLRTQNAMRDWHKVAFITKDVSDATIGTGNFTQGIPAFWFARGLDGGGGEGMNHPYAQSAWVRRAIKYVSGPISSVDLVFSKPTTSPALRRWKKRGSRLHTKNGWVKRDPNSEVELPQIREWLKEPMAGLTYEDFVEASIGWYKLQECFWLLADKGARVPFPEVKANPYAPIIVARPDRMRPTKQGNQIIAWNFTDEGGKVWELEPEQVVRLFGWNPYDQHRGLGDYASAHLAAETHHLGSKFKRNLTADNDTAPIISAKNGTPTDTQIEQIKMSIMERRAARMRGNSKALFLPGEVDVHDPKILSVDAAFIAGMLEDRHEIFVAFGVPPSLADVKASYSIGQASDWFALIFNTCIPEGGKFCAAVETLIFRLTGQHIEVGLDWDDHYVMQQVRSERMKDADSLFAKGVPMSVVDEYLDLGLPEYPEKKQGYIPINLTPVSAAANEAAQTVPQPGADDFTEAGNDDEPEALKIMKAAFAGKNNGQCGTHKSGKSKAIWEAHMRLRSVAVKQYQSKASKVLMEYRATALKHLAAAHADKSIATKSLVDVIFNPENFGRDLKKNLDPVTRSVLQRAGDELMAEIGEDQTGEDPWKMAPMKALHFISLRDKLLDSVGETAQAQLNTALATGMDKGETTAELTDRVRGVFNNLQKYEARRIAMTETSAAYGYARHEAMTDAGIEYKGWLSSHGPTVREAHAAAEEQYGDAPIPLDQPFIVDGEELMYPGDPSGSAGNVINCHCIQTAEQKPEGENA
ncbi:MAG: phage portal protein [Verrucomicrobiae bacterium]|nr:phage portal protein [Verrucomicrobiae bacterium]